MNSFVTIFLVFFVAGTMQNLVLTAGFDSSLLIKITKNPRQLSRLGILLLLFSLCTTALFYPIDILLPTTWLMRMLRPVIIVCIDGLLYLLSIVILRRSPTLYRRNRHLLALAAFNNLVVGTALLLNLQVSVSFVTALSLSIGASVGFTVVCAMTAEAVERMDNPDIPAAFRGLPATLVYLGLLALALMGFTPVLNLT